MTDIILYLYTHWQSITNYNIVIIHICISSLLFLIDESIITYRISCEVGHETLKLINNLWLITRFTWLLTQLLLCMNLITYTSKVLSDLWPVNYDTYYIAMLEVMYINENRQLANYKNNEEGGTLYLTQDKNCFFL